MSARPREKQRDAQRSRAAILAAGERLFAERGFDGVSLSDIGAAAGLSRGSPSYLFGSKDALYGEVLATAFARRQEATCEAFAPVLDWCSGREGVEGLRRALTGAASGYVSHLLAHPSFVGLVLREELEQRHGIPDASRASTAMRDAFSAVRRAGASRGVRRFRVEQAVMLFVSLTFGPVSLRRTLLPAQGAGLETSADVRRQARLTADLMTRFLSSAAADGG